MPRQDQLALDPNAALEEYGPLLSRPEAAALACCSVRTIERMVERGELPMFRVGSTRTYRIRTKDLLARITQVA